MNRLVFTLLVFLMIAGTTVLAQENYIGRKQLRHGQIDRMNAERQIKELRTNVLLVRLRTRIPLIEALEKANRHEEAEMVKARQLKENKEIIANFKAHFDFCPTYFFYSNYSSYIYDDLMDSLIFLDDSAAMDPKIKLTTDLFYIAEFSTVKQDTAVYHTDTYLYRGSNGIEQRRVYEGGGNFGFGALIFKSSGFYQLRRPFPYYSRTLSSLPLMRRSHRRVIQRANEALHYYYNKVY